MDNATDRFFVALVLPEPLQDTVNLVKKEFRDRYNSRKAFNSPPHITIIPPFHWPMADIPQIQESLYEFTINSFPLPVPIQLRGFGAFAPKVIFVNVIKTPELMALQTALTGHFQDNFPDLPPSKHRSFEPHVTVAFRDLKATQFKQAWPKFEHRTFEADFIASHLHLLHHNGQHWNVFSQTPFNSDALPDPEI